MAAGVLAAHALAYRITGTGPGGVHGYLEHAPQVLLVLTALGLLVAGFAARLRVLSAWPFPVVAVATFVAQEHLERVAHTGHLPWLLLSAPFLVGLVLQVPFALLAWWLARRLLALLREPRAAQPVLPRLLLPPVVLPATPMRAAVVATHRGRAPPLLRDP
jgi:hypothetical protein